METCNNKTVDFSTLLAVIDNDQIESESLIHELTNTI